MSYVLSLFSKFIGTGDSDFILDIKNTLCDSELVFCVPDDIIKELKLINFKMVIYTVSIL